jgi:hypothetical protein
MNTEGHNFVGRAHTPVHQYRQPGLVLLLLVFLLGCSRPALREGFIFTQAPVNKVNLPSAVDALDLRYPAGSRVMLADSGFTQLKSLSQGLYSAGDPQVTWDGKRVLFCAKASPGTEWQIYEIELGHRRYRQLTRMPGGAASPNLLPDGRVLFVSPVTKIGATHPAAGVLYAQAPGEQPKALTFTPLSVSDPSVLDDGRILFVGTKLGAKQQGMVTCGLFTINNDGTEITQFSRPQEQRILINRPRQIGGNRIFYLVSETGSSRGARAIEFIRCGRPFAAAEGVALPGCDRLRSVQPGANGTLLVSATALGAASSKPFALYEVNAESATHCRPLFADPEWDNLEVSAVGAYARPMGRLSTMDPTKPTGQILCLNVNYSRSDTTGSMSLAARVRVVAEAEPEKLSVLGEIPVQADGSFMAEVPADVPLGLEALDDQSHVLRRLSPTIWVRPGENRSCIGCHEPPNHAPTNHRPLAVRAPVPRLTLDNSSLVQANN